MSYLVLVQYIFRVYIAFVNDSDTIRNSTTTSNSPPSFSSKKNVTDTIEMTSKATVKRITICGHLVLVWFILQKYIAFFSDIYYKRSNDVNQPTSVDTSLEI